MIISGIHPRLPHVVNEPLSARATRRQLAEQDSSFDRMPMSLGLSLGAMLIGVWLMHAVQHAAAQGDRFAQALAVAGPLCILGAAVAVVFADWRLQPDDWTRRWGLLVSLPTLHALVAIAYAQAGGNEKVMLQATRSLLLGILFCAQQRDPRGLASGILWLVRQPFRPLLAVARKIEARGHSGSAAFSTMVCVLCVIVFGLDHMAVFFGIDGFRNWPALLSAIVYSSAKVMWES